MFLEDRPRIELLHKCDNLVIPFRKGQTHDLTELLHSLEELNLNKDYIVKIERKRLKRSLDANAYLWVLINKLGAKLQRPDIDVYREYIKDCGVFQIIPVREDLIENWKKVWGIRGDGWICEDIGECRNTKGYHNIKSYFGTSVYDTIQMSRMIDAVILDCREQGIETMTPNELEKVKAMWGEKDVKP